jgi:prostaglandin-E synthase 1
MHSPLLVAYAITALALSLNLFVLWAMSGAVRTRSKTARNPEDAAQFKVAHVDADPPAVARVLRAHANAEAAIYPFLILGLVYVLTGGGFTAGAIIFAVFVVARVLHSVFYAAAKQPWRTISFSVGGLATLALMVALVIRLVALAGH